jgi:hypothetical protein
METLLFQVGTFTVFLKNDPTSYAFQARAEKGKTIGYMAESTDTPPDSKKSSMLELGQDEKYSPFKAFTASIPRLSADALSTVATFEPDVNFSDDSYGSENIFPGDENPDLLMCGEDESTNHVMKLEYLYSHLPSKTYQPVLGIWPVGDVAPQIVSKFHHFPRQEFELVSRKSNFQCLILRNMSFLTTIC